MRRGSLLVGALALVGAAASAGSANAWWPQPRWAIGGAHPYHMGQYYIPPSSAYEAPHVFPPVRYGIPAYYVPGSYLPASMGGGHYHAYPGIPAGRAGGYYMSAYATARW